MNKYNYPLFKSKLGNLTENIKNQYLNENIKIGKLHASCLKDKKVNSLIASNDLKDEIFFWQLYSILGEKPVHDLIEKFYTKVFNDIEADWFREEFIETGTIKYHIRGQKKFWLDIMGGGEMYKGGEIKLYKKHKLVEDIMTLEGATRWMMFMNQTLKEMRFFEIKDKRIIKCIKKFLYFFMKKYSVQFDFNFLEFIKMQSKL